MKVVHTLEMNVRGRKRNVHLGEYDADINAWRAKVNDGKVTITGLVRENVNGVKAFYARGKNASQLS